MNYNPINSSHRSLGWVKFTFVLFLWIFVGFVNKAVGQEAYAVKSLDETTLTFYYDDQKSNREGTVYGMNTGGNRPGWVKYDAYAKISNHNYTKVIFDASFAAARPTSCYEWFMGFTNLTSITDLKYLNTSEVTTMSNMFDGCGNLTTIDVTNFETEKVTDMYHMFYNCSNLTILELSSFNTEHVTDMRGMFCGCGSLTTILVDDDKWDIQSLSKDTYMFSNCFHIIGEQGTTYNYSYKDKTYARVDESINGIPGYFTSGTTYKIFYDLAGGVLPTGTTNPTSYSAPKNTTEIILQEPIKDNYVFDGWIESSNKLGKNVVIPVGAIGNRYYYARWVDRIANNAYVELSADGKTLIFKGGEKPQDGGTYYLMNTEWVTSENQANVTSVVFDPSFYNCAPENCAYWFDGFANLKRIYGIQYLRTSRVKTMSHMFSGCRSLIAIDFRYFDTRKVVDLSYMFQNCETLIGVTNFNINPAANVAGIFWNCKNLISIFNYGGSLDYSLVLNCNMLITDASSRECGNTAPEYVVVVYGSNLINFHCPSKATKVIFDVSCKDVRPTTFSSMFYNCKYLTEITGLENLNTEDVTEMQSMFDGCVSLKELDLHTFNTSNVKKMQYMFDDCVNLTTLDLRSFDTRKVEDMSYMFRYCFNLRTILVSDKWTKNTTSKTSDAIYYCFNMIGSNGSKYDHDKRNSHNYLKEDGGESDPGFFTLNNYRISYDLDGGLLPQGKTNPDSYSTEEPITLVSPKKVGYRFLGWTRADLGYSQENNQIENQEDEEIVERLLFDHEFCMEYKIRFFSPVKDEIIPVNGVGNRWYKANWKKLYTVTLPEHIEFVGEVEAESDGNYYFDPGTTVSFKVADGYVVKDEITATTTTVIVNTDGNGTYFITVPASDVTINATVKKQIALNASVEGWVYGNTPNTPSITKNGVDIPLPEVNLQYTNANNNDVSISNTTPVGIYTLTATYPENVVESSASVSTTFSITPLVIDPSDPAIASLLQITLTPDSYIYDGTAKEPRVTITYKGIEIPSSEYIVSYENNINVGTATAIITDNPGGNYTINANKDFSITPIEINLNDPKFASLFSIVINPDSYIYDGKAKEPAVTITYKGTEIPAAEYTVTYLDNINVGTAKAIITDNQGGNYTINGDAPFTINPFVITTTDPNLSIIIETTTYEYTGSPIEPKVTVTYNGTTIPSTEYTVSYKDNTNVGTATVIITDNPNGNYTINGTAPFTITPGIIHITAANVDENGVIIADASNEYFCKGKAVIDFTVQTGTPENYTIEFDGGEISSQNGAITGNSIEIALPKDLRPGTYNGFMELTSNAGISTGKLPIRVIINLPFYTIVTLYNDVAAVNQLAGEFSAYKWTENGSEISGANGRILQHTFNKSSVYTAILTKTDGGSYETCPLDLSRISVGNSTARLVVYPNPAIQGNDITVEVSENYNPEANKQIYIYNLNGTLAKHLSSPQEINKVQLPTGNYSGVYIQNGEKVPFKLIVK